MTADPAILQLAAALGRRAAREDHEATLWLSRRDYELRRKLRRVYPRATSATVEYEAYAIDAAVRIADRANKSLKVSGRGVKIKHTAPTLSEAFRRLEHAAASGAQATWATAWLETPPAAKEFIRQVMHRNDDRYIELSGQDAFGTPIPGLQTVVPVLALARAEASMLRKPARSTELGATIAVAFVRLCGRPEKLSQPKLSQPLLTFIAMLEQFYGLDFRLKKGAHLAACVAEARWRLQNRG